MARERFDDGSQHPDGSTFTIDSPQNWGGNGGTYTNHQRGNGTSYLDFIGNGETEDVNRYRDMGADAQKRGAYQLDWNEADADHANSVQAGNLQGDANDVLRKQAMGQDNISSDFQGGLLQKGAQQQQGAALSAAGGPLAQIGAKARTTNSASAYMQRGNMNIAANRANDMATGRAGLAAGEAAQRKADLMSQGLDDQQAEAQAQSELAQRDLNDQRQLHDEGMAVNVEQQALGSRQHQAANSKLIQQAQYDKGQADKNRALGYVNSGVKIVGNTAAPGVGDAAASGGSAATGTNTGGDPNNPANQPVSDENAKNKQPGALVKLYHDVKSRRPKSATGEPIMSQADTFGDVKKKPLLLSVADDQGGQSTMLPSDEILENWRTAHQHPDAKPGDAPAPDVYDRSMFSKNDDATIGTDALHKGIESKIAHSDKMRTDYDFDQQADAQRARENHSKNRVGTVGDVTGGGPEATYDLGFGKGKSDDRGLAPGTGDAIKYGAMRPDLSKDEASWRDFKSDGKTHNFDDFSSAVMTSDENAKNRVETPEQKKAREDKQDADDTAAFMKDVKPEAITVKKPETYEEASKAIDERNAQDKQIQENRKRANEEQAKSYMGNQDAELIRRNNTDKWLPGFVRRWSNEKIEARARARTPDQNIQQAVSRDKRDVERRATEHQYDQRGPTPIRKFVEDLNVATAKPRQPTSFTRGDNSEATLDAEGKADQIAFDREHQTSDEDAKNKGYAMNKGAGGGEKESDGTTWEHRGPAITEAPPVPSDSPRGAPQGGETRENDRTSVTRSNPLIEMQKDANRRLAGETYTYKDGYGEDTSKLHHGFMAQNLEKNPITALAVVDDGTGVKKVDNVEALRHTAAGVASLQEQHDELEDAIASLISRRGKKRIA